MEVWHNVPCPTSQRIRESLDQAGLGYRTREYMVNSPSAAETEIDDLLKRIQAEPWGVARMHDPVAARLVPLGNQSITHDVVLDYGTQDRLLYRLTYEGAPIAGSSDA
ncbi:MULTISPECIES: hypothetical protein [unclassified Streptomyces]|uniref:hypothetical protein n=1 Tax=unclassified Streptomyces TaxID=2593676 RepID=UPI0036EC1574